MTIRVTFDGWVNDVKSFDWGHVLKMAHDRRAQNKDTGEWETVGKDYIDVIIDDEQLAFIQGEKLVHVEGTQKELRAYSKATGELAASQTLKATHVAALRKEMDSAADRLGTVLGATPTSWDEPF